MSMRPLHVPHAYDPAIGGAETLCRRIGIELAERGHEVSVLTPDWISAEGWFTPGVGVVESTTPIDRGVRVRRVSLDRRIDRIGGNRSLRLERRFRRALEVFVEQVQPDVMLALPHLLPNVRTALRVSAERSVPTVIVPLLHEDDPFWPFEDLRAALRRASATLAMTQVEADRLVTGYGVDRDRVFVSGLGVDPIPAAGPPSGPPTVVSLGRLAPSKNLPVLVTAMAHVWTRHPQARLILAGASVPGEPVEELLSGLREEERSRITIETDVELERKVSLLRSAHCFASASTRESFGLVTLEAMAHTVPVVCPDTPVNREVTGGAALLVPADPSAIALGILQILDDPSRARELALRGKAHSETNYGWSRVADVVEQAYRMATTHPVTL